VRNLSKNDRYSFSLRGGYAGNSTDTEDITMKLIQAKSLKAAITNLLGKANEVTLSLAYYSMVDGNTAPLEGLEKDVVNRLSKEYKQFVCASWSEKDGKWAYNKTKAIKLLGQLGLEFKNATFDEFYDALQAYVKPITLEVTGAVLHQRAVKSIEAAFKKALANGLTATELTDLLRAATK